MTGRLAASWWARALLTVVVLVLLAWRIDVRATAAAVLRLDGRLALLVAALLVVDRAAMIWRWVLLLRADGTPVAGRTAVRIHLVSSFVGGFLPAGVGADAARAYSLSRHTAQRSEAVASVGVDRLLGLLSILAMGLLGLAVVAGSGGGGLAGGAVPAMVVLVAAGGATLLWADRWVRRVLPPRVRESGPGRRVMRLADAFGRYRGHRRTLGAVFALSFGVQLLRIVQAYLLGRGIGVDVPFSYYLLFMPVGLMALMLPISVAGFGLPQGIIVWLLQPRGVPSADSLALSTLIVLTGILGNLPGAWLYLRARRPATPGASG